MSFSAWCKLIAIIIGVVGVVLLLQHDMPIVAAGYGIWAILWMIMWVRTDKIMEKRNGRGN